MTLFKLRQGQYLLVEEKVQPTAMAIGKAARDLGLPAECVLVCVIRKGQIFIPEAGKMLEPGDEVLAVVHASQRDKLKVLLGPMKQT